MTTKEQERKALEQIRKIVADLGEDSYIGMAFEGCFEIAESNIENDFGDSMLDRAEYFEKKELEAREKLVQMDGEMKLLQRALEENKDIASKRGDRIEELNGQLKEAVDLATERLGTILDYQSRQAEQENEIIRLKARLYDLLCK